MTTDLDADFEAHVAQAQRNLARAAEMVAAEPGLSFITAVTLAGDESSMERSKDWYLTGEMDFWQAANYVGSFYRLAFHLWGLEEGHITRETLVEHLPEVWVSSDPRHLDRDLLLSLWRDAYAANGNRTVRDGKHLPKGKTLRVYRGQRKGAAPGIAWSLDLKVAQRFAAGAAHRHAIDGYVIAFDMPRSMPLAYLTSRGENEVILDPAGLRPNE